MERKERKNSWLQSRHKLLPRYDWCSFFFLFWTDSKQSITFSLSPLILLPHTRDPPTICLPWWWWWWGFGPTRYHLWFNDESVFIVTMSCVSYYCSAGQKSFITSTIEESRRFIWTACAARSIWWWLAGLSGSCWTATNLHRFLSSCWLRLQLAQQSTMLAIVTRPKKKKKTKISSKRLAGRPINISPSTTTKKRGPGPLI